MSNKTNIKPAYDLEERTFQFAKAVRLIEETNELDNHNEVMNLRNEANELKMILSAIINKSE